MKKITLYFLFTILLFSCGNSEPEDPLQAQFSSWDGSHPALTELIKKSMNDPDSYEHVETKFKKEGENRIYVITKFRGKNAFGGKITKTVHAIVDYNGNVLEVINNAE